MKIKKFRYFVGDFETTVYKGQVHTEVWASAVVELNTEDVQIFHSIGDTFDYLASIPDNIIIYYHNLKFDGSFWLDQLLTVLGYEQAYDHWIDPDSTERYEWLKERHMKNKTFKYSISNMGQWYTIIIRVNNKFIEIRDSLKLLPFSVKRIGDSFKTAHRKLDMEYTGVRYAGCPITEEEQEYIRNDVLVIKEALEIMYEQGHDKLTIGSCCLAEYQKIISKEEYNSLFPNLYEMALPEEDAHKYPNAGEWIRMSYKGGWCYLVKGKEHKVFNGGTTADVNSLYPSMMSSESGNRYPVGHPNFWTGNYIPPQAISNEKYYFVRIKTRFKIKEGYLPFIQIKNSLMYRSNECLTTSSIWSRRTHKYYRYYRDTEGNVQDTRVELVLTMTDFELLKEHYHLMDFEILDGCWFYALVGIFDDYIEKYKKIKLESEGALRELAKLFLNNLYGKMASNTDSSFKVAELKEDKTIRFNYVSANDKKPGYIPVGSAITSYARNFTIRAAQKNYHGVHEPGFIYADTDSIHCDLPADKLQGITVHDKNFCCWKLEAYWDEAIFTRQKTYIEHVTHEDGVPVCEKIDKETGEYRKPYYNVKCAGMPTKCKDLFVKSLTGYQPTEDDKFTEEELEFIRTPRELTDFNVGLIVPGKLRPKRIRGGVVLTDTTYEMR